MSGGRWSQLEFCSFYQIPYAFASKNEATVQPEQLRFVPIFLPGVGHAVERVFTFDLSPAPQGRSSPQGSQRATLCLARFLEIEKSGQEPAPDGAARIHVVVPVHATLKTLREVLWFEVNPRPLPR